MKKLLVCLALVCVTGCSTVQKVTSALTSAGSSPTTVTTLKVLGATVDSTMTIAAGLYHNGQITTAQWNAIAAFHDNEFLPAYNLAVAAVENDTNQPAAPSLIALAGQLVTTVQQMTSPSPTPTPTP